MAPIAIITVTFSPGEHLGAFLNSVPGATSQGARVVMVDNGSTDGAPEQAIAERERGEAYTELDLVLHYSGGNLGYGRAMNAGARLLREARNNGEIDPDYLVISNPDVVFGVDAIDRMRDVAESNPRAGAVGPLIREADGSVYPSARSVPRLGAGIGHALLGTVWPGNPWSKKYRHDDDMARQREAEWLSGSCLLMRWEAFESVGGFDERYFMYMEDVDLGDRLGRAGWKNIFTPSAEIRHAKGHAAGEVPELMLPAHHESAYRFQADRIHGWYAKPVLLALKVGLAARAKISVAAARARRRK